MIGNAVTPPSPINNTATRPGGAREVEDAEPRPEVPVRLRREREFARRAVAAHLPVVGGALPHRHARMRQVGDVEQRVIAALLERVERHLPARPTGARVKAPRHLLATAGEDAAALGVATLPIYNVFAPAPRVLLKQSRDQRSGFNETGMGSAARRVSPLARPITFS